MATYLSGVTDYIPQFQPFQPDLNFYGNIMQTKQTQYDNNWKALNDMYGKYYYADLTRQSNVNNRDQYIKNAEFNLQRVSQMDLSLEQNANQALQVFKPFYEDKNLIKDMVWTKNFNSEMSRAEALKGSSDPERNKQYWNTGVAAMQYLKEEFKNADDAKASSFGNVAYTPFVDVQEKAMAIAKDFGDIESANFSKDGRWLIKSRNGQQLEEPLTKLFESRLGNDPAVQEMYKTQAYVDRKTYAKTNAAQFNGDENAAEMKYLENQFTVLKAQNNLRYMQLQENQGTYDKRIADIQKQIDNGTAGPDAKMQIEALRMNKDINGQVLDRAKKENDLLNGGQVDNAAGSNGFKNPYGDIESLRYKVDSGVASSLMQKSLGEAAHVLAYRNSKVDLDANIYKVNEEKFQQNAALTKMRIQGAKEVAMLKENMAAKREADKARVAAGTHYYDENNQAIAYEDQKNFFVIKNAKGSATDKQNAIGLSRDMVKMKTTDAAMPWAKNTVSTLFELYNNGKISKQKLNEILHYDKNPNISLTEFNKKLQNNPVAFLTREVGTKDLENIKDRYDNWIRSNSQLSELKGDRAKKIVSSNIEFQDYINYVKEDKSWRQESTKAVERQLMKGGYGDAAFLYDQSGTLRTEKEFKAAVYNKTGRSSNVDYKDMLASADEAWRSEKVVRKPVVGLSQFYTKGTGVFSEGATALQINPRSSYGRKYYGEVYNDLRNMDFGDTTKVRASFQGYSKTNWDQVGGAKNAKVAALLSQLQADMNSPKSKVGTFTLGVAPVATGSTKRSAVIIKPTNEWLKQYVSTDKDQKNNLLTQQEAQAILKNGINIMTDSKGMNNSMYKASFKDPLSAYVDSRGKYSYADPLDGRYKIDITKNEFGTGDYTVTTQYPLWNPETGKYVLTKVTETQTSYGNNLTSARNQMAFDYFDYVKASNQYYYNGQ
jgi:transcription elongation GreA/GreB family factor